VNTPKKYSCTSLKIQMCYVSLSHEVISYFIVYEFDIWQILSLKNALCGIWVFLFYILSHVVQIHASVVCSRTSSRSSIIKVSAPFKCCFLITVGKIFGLFHKNYDT